VYGFLSVPGGHYVQETVAFRVELELQLIGYNLLQPEWLFRHLIQSEFVRSSVAAAGAGGTPYA
jgi:hypothetical protein